MGALAARQDPHGGPGGVEGGEIWTAPDVARYLRISERQVRKLAARGALPAIHLGKNWRFARQVILALGRGELLL